MIKKKSRMRNNRRDTKVKASWKKCCGGTAMEQASWSRIIKKKSWRRDRGGGAVTEIS